MYIKYLKGFPLLSVKNTLKFFFKLTEKLHGRISLRNTFYSPFLLIYSVHKHLKGFPLFSVKKTLIFSTLFICTFKITCLSLLPPTSEDEGLFSYSRSTPTLLFFISTLS